MSARTAARLLLVLLLAALALPLAAGCSRQDADSAQPGDIRFLIGMSQANLVEPWRVKMNEEIRLEAQSHSDAKVIFSDAGQDSQRQIEDIRKMVAQGIDLLIVSPNNAALLRNTIVEVYQKIPVIVLDRAIDGYDYTLFIGPDNTGIGMQAGEYVARLLGNAGGKVIEIQGLYGSPPVRDRSDGFHQVIAQYPDIQIVRTVFADWLRDRTEDRVGEILREVPDVDIIFAQSDAMAYGAWKAAKSLGLEGKIRFVGVDGLPGIEGGLSLVQKDILKATFTCATGGREAMQYALDILNRQSGVPKKIILRSDLVTDENIAAQIEELYKTPDPARADPSTVTVGFSQLGAETQWRLANTDSVLTAARQAGVRIVYRNAEGSQTAQIEALREFIRLKVSAIILAPIVESGWDDVLAEAKAAGIPVVLSNRRVTGPAESLCAAWVGSDFFEQGRRVARWLVGRLGEQQPVNIVEIQGTEGSSSTLGRAGGFREVLAGYAGYRILRSELSDYSQEMGRQQMARLLAEIPEKIDVLYAYSDDLALGAIEAIQASGLKPGKDILVVSVDGEKAAFEAMIAGKLNCTVENNPLYGDQLMKTILDLLAGRRVPMRIHSSEGIFPAETAARYISSRRY